MEQNRGFTLIELIAIIVVLSLVAVIAFPSVIGILSNSKKNTSQIQKSEIIRAAKDWAIEHPKELPLDGQVLKVKLSELKNGYLSLNVKNLETGAVLSNETYVKITNQAGKYEYEVTLFDIPSKVEADNICTVNGDFNVSMLANVSDWAEILSTFSTTCPSGYSIQYFKGEEEVLGIQEEGTTSVIYTFLSDNKIYKRTKIVTVR